MAQYRLALPINAGFGTITVDGGVPDPYYEEGTSLTIAIALNTGFLTVEWFRLGVSISTATSFTFVMPSSDAKLFITASGDAAPVDGFGLKYFTEFLDIDGVEPATTGLIRIEVLFDGYGGSATELKTQGCSINFGDNTKLLTNIIIGQSLDFTLVNGPDSFTDMLSVGFQDCMVICYKNSVIKFRGFLSPDFIEYEDYSGNQIYNFTAIDGLKALDSIRCEPLVFLAGSSGKRDKAHEALIGCLNQSFVNKRKVNIACDLYEDLMDNYFCVFEQFFYPEAAIYTDGERAKYSDGNVVWNNTLFLSEVIEILLKPFGCRVFLWEDEFYIVRIADMNQATVRLFKFEANSDFDELGSIINDQVIECNDISITPKYRTGRAYTEFTALLNLGVLVQQAEGAIYEAKFSVDDWRKNSSAFIAYPNLYVLKNWDYVKANPIGKPTSIPTGDTARIQYVSDANGEACQIWTTTTTSGTSDINISYILLDSNDAGIGFIVADETANLLSIEFEYAVAVVNPSGVSNTIGNHGVAIEVKIGDYYLRESGTANVYEFSLTANIIEFPVPNINTFNVVKITNVQILNTDFVQVKLFQLICNGGTRHQFTVRYKNFKLSIEENEAFTLSQLGAKGVTNTQYSSVFPDYEINIGDTITNMSTSAIKLNLAGTPVSESWTSKDYTSQPLLGGIVQDLANLYGRPSQILSGTIQKLPIAPYEAFIHKGKYWAFINFTWDMHMNSYEFQAYDLGEIETT
jgi:hypothetical protein